MTTHITGDDMRAGLAGCKRYVAVILTAVRSTRWTMPPRSSRSTGRRNFALRAEGLVDMVCQVTGDTA
jgi:hypothetical protein